MAWGGGEAVTSSAAYSYYTFYGTPQIKAGTASQATPNANILYLVDAMGHSSNEGRAAQYQLIVNTAQSGRKYQTYNVIGNFVYTWLTVGVSISSSGSLGFSVSGAATNYTLTNTYTA